MSLIPVLIVGGLTTPTRAQLLSEHTLSLYPQDAGEVVFVDIQTARRSPQFDQLKAQVLPGRFNDLARLAANLGVDFDRNVDRLSWAYVNKGDAAKSDFLGVVEGQFDLDEVRQRATKQKIRMTMYNGARAYSLGKNDLGQEFIFAFLDNGNCLFGFGGPVHAMIDRAAQGGSSLLNNDAMRKLVEEVNRSSPIWMVMDGDFTQLGVHQFLGGTARVPGVETLGRRVHTATVRIDLDSGLAANVAARCATSADALWFSSFLRGALVIESELLKGSDATMAKVVGESKVQQTEDQVTLALAIPPSDLQALLDKKSLTLRF